MSVPERQCLQGAVVDPDTPFRGAHEMRLNAKGTVESLEGEN